MMNKRERVYAVLNGDVADRVPTGFWMHFPERAFFGQPSVQAHIDFFEQTRTDMCKVMTENIYPCDKNIESAADWKHVREYNEDAPFIVNQAEIIHNVVQQCKNAPIVATVHGIVASASHTLLGEPRYDTVGRFAQLYHLRTNPEGICSAYKKIANSMCCMVRACVKAGADGIYYAALGGESDCLKDEEHAEFVAPLDKMVLEAAYDAGAKFVVLHMCKPKVNLRRFVDYPCDIVNWGIVESGVSLSEGRKLFPDKVVLGGFNNNDGTLISGSSEQIEEETFQIIDEAGEQGLMLGSDCTLPSNLVYNRIAEVAKASERYAALKGIRSGASR